MPRASACRYLGSNLSTIRRTLRGASAALGFVPVGVEFAGDLPQRRARGSQFGDTDQCCLLGRVGNEGAISDAVTVGRRPCTGAGLPTTTRAQSSHLRLVCGGCSQHVAHTLAGRIRGYPTKFSGIVWLQRIHTSARRAHFGQQLLLHDERAVEAVETVDDETLRQALMERGQRLGESLPVFQACCRWVFADDRGQLVTPPPRPVLDRGALNLDADPFLAAAVASPRYAINTAIAACYPGRRPRRRQADGRDGPVSNLTVTQDLELIRPGAPRSRGWADMNGLRPVRPSRPDRPHSH